MIKQLIILIIVILVLVGGFFLLQQYKPNQNPNNNGPTTLPTGIVFFYGDTCSHCKDVEDFIKANPQIDQNVKYTKLEVFKNPSNSQLLFQVEKGCGVDVSQGASVPVLYDGTKCYLGAPDTINFLKNAAGIK